MTPAPTSKPAPILPRVLLSILILLTLALPWITYRTGRALAWGAVMAAMTGLLLIFPLWLVWLTTFSWLCLHRFRGYAKTALRLLLCLAIAAGSLWGIFQFVGHVATTARNREIQQALDQGLYADCIALLDNWPSKNDRIFSGDVPLPKSVESFNPAYVTNDALHYPDLGPPNIGLCKNGFGGFAEGLRIFRNDADAQRCITARGAHAQRIAPGVYYWREST